MALRAALPPRVGRAHSKRSRDAVAALASAAHRRRMRNRRWCTGPSARTFRCGRLPRKRIRCERRRNGRGRTAGRDMTLRATVVTFVAHGGRSLARDDGTCCMTRQTFVGTATFDSVRNRRRSAVVGAKNASCCQHALSLFLGLWRNLVERSGEPFTKAIDRPRVHRCVGAAPLGPKLRIARCWSRCARLSHRTRIGVLPLLRDSGEEADRGNHDPYRTENVHETPRRILAWCGRPGGAFVRSHGRFPVETRLRNRAAHFL